MFATPFVGFGICRDDPTAKTWFSGKVKSKRRERRTGDKYQGCNDSPIDSFLCTQFKHRFTGERPNQLKVKKIYYHIASLRRALPWSQSCGRRLLDI